MGVVLPRIFQDKSLYNINPSELLPNTAPAIDNDGNWVIRNLANASLLTEGILAFARLPVGNTSSTVAAGNHTHTLSNITDLSSVFTLDPSRTATTININSTGLVAVGPSAISATFGGQGKQLVVCDLTTNNTGLSIISSSGTSTVRNGTGGLEFAPQLNISQFTGAIKGSTYLHIGSHANPTNSGVGVITATKLNLGNVATNAQIYLGGNISASSWDTSGIGISVPAATYTDTSSAAGQNNNILATHAIARPTLSSTNAVTRSLSTTVYFEGEPIAGSPTVLTSPYTGYSARGSWFFGNGSGGSTTITGNQIRVTRSAANGGGSVTLEGDFSRSLYMTISGSSGTTLFTGGPSLANSAGIGTNFSAIQFGTASTFAGIVDASQRWGFGTASPTHRVTVTGDVALSGVLTSGSVADIPLILQSNTATSGNTSTLLAFNLKVGNSGSTSAIQVINSGNVGIGPNITASSSRVLTVGGGSSEFTGEVIAASLRAQHAGGLEINPRVGTGFLIADTTGFVSFGSSSPTAKISIAGNYSFSTADSGINGILFNTQLTTITDSFTAASTTTSTVLAANTFNAPTFAATNNNVTRTTATNLYVAAPIINTANTHAVSNAWSAIFAGTVRVDNHLIMNGGQIRLSTSGGAAYSIFYNATTQGMSYNANSGAGSHTFSTNSVERMKILVTGQTQFTSNIELTAASTGVILKSPNGTRYILTVADAGTLNVATA